MKKINNKYSVYLVLLIFLAGSFKLSAQSDSVRVRELLLSTRDKSKKLEEIVIICDDAIKLADEVNYLQGKADAYNIRGKAYLNLADYSKATESFWEEYALRDKNPDWSNSSLGQTCNMIGESYRAIGSFDLALKYLEKGLQINEQKNDKREIAFSYNRMAAVYHEIAIRETDTNVSLKADLYALKSVEINKNDTNNIINSYNIVGAANIFRRNYKAGLKYLFLALEYIGSDSTYIDKPNILNNIASTYFLKGDYKDAIKYGLISYELSKKSGVKIYIQVAARGLSITYKELNDYANAYKYLNEADVLYLKIFDDKKTAEIYSFQKKHEIELNEQEQREKRTKMMIIGIAFFLLVTTISSGIYIRHRQQLRINKELEYKNEVISKQKDNLTKSNASKDKFFSILSHDIKNPLNGILGFSNILEVDYDDISDEEKKKYIGYVKTSSESLYKLVDRLLIWSRLQTHNIESNIEDINLREIVLNIIDLHKVNAIRKGIILVNNFDKDIIVKADNYLLDMVLRNLIDNAIKFTEQGGKISVTYEISGKKITVNVFDNGVGIKKEDLNKIFLIDQKTVTSGTAKEEGTGLGLILCKDMLELMDTKLEVESEEGEGSRFYFELQLGV